MGHIRVIAGHQSLGEPDLIVMRRGDASVESLAMRPTTTKQFYPSQFVCIFFCIRMRFGTGHCLEELYPFRDDVASVIPNPTKVIA
jgi:hypothetical protein